MEQVEIKAEIRESTGKGAARKLRALGRVPGVVYGPGQQPVTISLDGKEITDLLSTGRAMRTLVKLEIQDRKELEKKVLMFREIQRNHIYNNPLAADLLVVDPTKPILLSVPLLFNGIAAGIKDGGVLQQLRHDLQIMALPVDVPESIEVDVSGLDVGQTLYISDLETSASVQLVAEERTPICTLIVPRGYEELQAEDEAAAAAAEAAAEAEEGEEGEKDEKDAEESKESKESKEEAPKE